MEYYFLRGFLLVLLIQHSMTEDPSTTAVTLQEGQALPLEQELAHAEVVPVVAPPSLEEVQQAVQEASEQVEGRGAEEVLKVLLERVVEAALGQAEAGGEAKVDETPEQETVEEELLGAVNEETDTGADVSDEVEGEDMGVKAGEAGVDEGQAVAQVDAVEGVVQEGEGGIEREVETVAEAAEEVIDDVETRDYAEEGVEVLDETTNSKVTKEVVEEAIASLDETGGYLVEDAGIEDNKEQVQLLEEKGMQEVEEPVMDVAVGGEPEQGTVVESEPGLVEKVGFEETNLEEETQIDDNEGEIKVPSSDNFEPETTHTAAGELVDEDVNVVKNTVGPDVEDELGLVVVGEAAVEVASESVGVQEEEQQEQSVITDSVNEGVGDQQAREEEQTALEIPQGTETEDEEALVISDPEPEDGADVSVEQSPENQAPSLSPPLGQEEIGENTLSDQKPNHGNEIITPTEGALPNDPIVAQPTLDNFVKDDLAEPPQAEVEEPGEANELVEESAGSTEKREFGLEAWKIGAISAAVFLVLETVIIIIYILKCRNKNSTLALQRACEEGCVEPEAATGGDCSDDTLPAGNGDTQQDRTVGLHRGKYFH